MFSCILLGSPISCTAQFFLSQFSVSSCLMYYLTSQLLGQIIHCTGNCSHLLLWRTTRLLCSSMCFHTLFSLSVGVSQTQKLGVFDILFGFFKIVLIILFNYIHYFVWLQHIEHTFFIICNTERLQLLHLVPCPNPDSSVPLFQSKSFQKRQILDFIYKTCCQKIDGIFDSIA